MRKILKIFIIAVVLIVSIPIVIFWKADVPLEELKAKYTNAESAFINIDGMQVHYRDQGIEIDSLPIVLIHGTGASLHTWEPWIQELKPMHRLISMDLPAYGLTGPMANKDYSLDAYARFLDQFLAKLNINKCILVGNSLGGAIACKYAIAYPIKVAKMVLVDPAGMGSTSKSVPLAFRLARMPIIKNLVRYVTPRAIIEKSVKNVYHDPSLVSEELIDRYFELSLRQGNRQAFVDKMESSNNSIEAQIKEIVCPVLLLWGKYDQLIPLAAANKFHASLPNDTLIILDKLGHVPMEENPQISLKPVLSFLK